MLYNEQQIMKAFKIYSNLAANGRGEKDELRQYLVDDQVRGLVDNFAKEVQAILIVAGDYIYLIPKADNSVFHVTNESIKKDYLPSKATNSDIYLMYLTIIILFGEFYDSYQSMNPTRDFIALENWLDIVNERIFSLKEHDEEKLIELEKDYSYNWIDVLNKWDPLDDLKENVKKQDARTASRLSILNTTTNFLLEQELIIDLGNNELGLTEKSKTIIQRYYMEQDLNRGILDFIYNIDSRGGE